VRKAAESTQTARIMELEAVVNSQVEKIAELETAYTDLKREKEIVAAGYRRLSDKHMALTEKAEREKVELIETHATELAKLRGDLDLETCSYTEYHKSVCRWLCELHKTVASSFNVVQAWCLPFPKRVVKVEEMIEWVAGEVKMVLDTVWQLNDNFVVLAIKGVLNMLNNEGCQELGRLHELAASSDTAVLKNVPKKVRKLAG
jgi:hypothetical protein